MLVLMGQYYERRRGMKKCKEKQKLVEEFYFVDNNNTLSICVDSFNMEAGFSIGCDVQEKIAFYTGVKAFSDCLREIAGILNEEKVYVGPCCRNESNYYKWKDIKNFDAYNNLRQHLKPYEIKLINISDRLVDLIIECNFRYFSQIAFYFPENRIFIRPDVHCWFEVSGNAEQTDRIYSFLKTASDGKYILSIENL